MHTCVGVDRTRHGGAITVLDLECTALLGCGRRRGRGEAMLRLAGRAGARRAGHPKVGRAGVEVDEEGLRGSTNADGAGPLEIVFLIGEGDAASRAFPERSGNHLELLDLEIIGQSAGVLLQVTKSPLVLAV